MMKYKKLDYNVNQEGVVFKNIDRFGDDRGDFTNVALENVKRSYIINNTQKGVVRAFHGHKQEGKYFYVPKGAFKFILIDMDTGSWKEYTLLDSVPKVLYCPAGYYNGFVSLTDDSLLITFSTSTMDDSRNDDFRIDYDVLGKDVWKVNNR